MPDWLILCCISPSSRPPPISGLFLSNLILLRSVFVPIPAASGQSVASVATRAGQVTTGYTGQCSSHLTMHQLLVVLLSHGHKITSIHSIIHLRDRGEYPLNTLGPVAGSELVLEAGDSEFKISEWKWKFKDGEMMWWGCLMTEKYFLCEAA